MSAHEIEVFARHRDQIEEWACLEGRFDELIREAVTAGDAERAISLAKGHSGDEQVDFFVRNRQTIAEWKALQPDAAAALHAELIAAAQRLGFEIVLGHNGWTTIHAYHDQRDTAAAPVTTELAWTKRNLLGVKGDGHPYPRLALWAIDENLAPGQREQIYSSTKSAAHALGMTRKAQAWVHWRPLDGVSQSQNVKSYAAGCMAALSEASEQLIPLALQALSEQTAG
ncbi:hypothetical protein EU513_08930 [Yimella sp. RIT 621]|uniref:hypothetical protein n=1 Tax=Yimella sp. RIT 621 TaxID=2510323 RepID=UPI00101B606B|nr:hypothetical protein [Yimella sp. RIT 621]RYG77062.1 hypothetical protein EU513_08930 [Yimella sp. RIT 621]